MDDLNEFVTFIDLMEKLSIPVMISSNFRTVYKRQEKKFNKYAERYSGDDIVRKAEILNKQYNSLNINDDTEVIILLDLSNAYKWLYHHEEKLFYNMYIQKSSKEIDQYITELKEYAKNLNESEDTITVPYHDVDKDGNDVEKKYVFPILRPGDTYYNGFKYYCFKVFIVSCFVKKILLYYKNALKMHQQLNLHSSGLFENARIIELPEDQKISHKVPVDESDEVSTAQIETIEVQDNVIEEEDKQAEIASEVDVDAMVEQLYILQDIMHRSANARQETERYRQEVKTVKSELAEALQKFEDQYTQLKQLKEDINEKNIDLQHKTDMLNTMKTQVTSMESKVSEYDNLLAEYIDYQDKTEVANKMQHQQIEKLNEEKKNIQEAFNAQSDIVTQLRKDLEHLKKENAERMNSALHDVRLQHKEEVEQLRKEIKTLKEQQTEIIPVHTKMNTLALYRDFKQTKACLTLLSKHHKKISENYDKVWFKSALQRQIFEETSPYRTDDYCEILVQSNILHSLQSSSKLYNLYVFDQHVYEKAMEFLRTQRRSY